MLLQQFGNRLRFLRNLKKVTQSRMAEEIGISEQHLGRIERGSSAPSFSLLGRICQVLGVEPAVLFLFPDPGTLQDQGVDPAQAGISMEWTRNITGKGIWMLEVSNWVCHWSQGMFRLLGYEPFSMTPDMDLLYSHLPQGMKQLVKSRLDLALQGRTGPAFDLELTTASGHVRNMVQHLDFMSQEGLIIYVWGVILDITESRALEKSLISNQRQLEEHVMERTRELDAAVTELQSECAQRQEAQQNLEDSREYLRTIFNLVNDGLIVHDTETLKILDANQRACELYGYTREEMLGLSIIDLSSDGAGRLDELISEIVIRADMDGPVVFEWQAARKDGSAFWVEVNLRRGMINGDEYFFASVRDIEERKMAQARQQELERRISQARQRENLEMLTGHLAHEFSNLLQIADNSLEGCLKQEDHLPSQVKVRIRKACKALKKAGSLTRRMINYSGSGRFLPENLHVHDILEELKEELFSQCGPHCRLGFELDKSLPSITADRDMLRHALKSLVSNACEALHRPDGEIIISTGACYLESCDMNRLHSRGQMVPGNYVRISVKDNGQELDSSVLEQVFNPLYYIRKAGKGLDMPALMTIAGKHGGGVSIEKRKDRGAVVSLFLPAFSLDDSCALQPQAGAEEEEQVLDALSAQGAVLIVDDEEMIREVCSELLEEAGYRVLTAVDGLDALETYQKNKGDISCVVLDLTMPRMNGVEAYQKLYAMDPAVKVIISSGFNPQKNLPASTPGVMGYLQKPYSFNQLLGELQRVLEAGMGN